MNEEKLTIELEISSKMKGDGFQNPLWDHNELKIFERVLYTLNTVYSNERGTGAGSAAAQRCAEPRT